jgi:hypothetical protein
LVWIDELCGQREPWTRCDIKDAMHRRGCTARRSDPIPFDNSACDAKIDPNDWILSIAERRVKYRSGTDCSLPLVHRTKN